MKKVVDVALERIRDKCKHDYGLRSVIIKTDDGKLYCAICHKFLNKEIVYN